MTYKTAVRPIGALALAAGLLTSAACSETALTGFVDDSELRDSAVVHFAAMGVARELNDLIYGQGNGSFFEMQSGVDVLLQDGDSQGENDLTLGNNRDRGQNFWYEQAHEALWASYKVVELAKGQFPAERFGQSPIVARSWLNAGWSERLLGDFFCEITYQYGPFGGFNLGNLGDGRYDRGNIVGQDSAFKRMAYSMEQAIAHADAAIVAGVPPHAADPEWFDPETIRLSAYAGLAEARVALASMGIDPEQNYAAAAAAAAEVPNSHLETVDTHAQLRDNENFDMAWENDNLTPFGMEIDGVRWGSQVYFLRDGPDDPRVQWAECGVYETPPTTIEELGSEDFGEANIVPGPDAGACFAEANNVVATEGGLPKWNPDHDTSWNQQYGSFVLVRGTEMRLIEAEAALAAGDLVGFTSAVNAARAFHGLDPIDQPASVGQLEYPNAEDDAWSILDREYMLDGWLDLRRLFHLNRWNHPFIAENHIQTPRHLTEPVDRMACFPLPENECNLNPDIDCPVLTGG